MRTLITEWSGPSRGAQTTSGHRVTGGLVTVTRLHRHTQTIINADYIGTGRVLKPAFSKPRPDKTGFEHRG